ncbi:MAG: DUF4349 domain-containing protein [Pseudomonadota bacterium]
MPRVLSLAIIIFAVGFVALFTARLAYDYYARPNGEVISSAQGTGGFIFGESAWSFASGVKNYASRSFKAGAGARPAGGVMDGGGGGAGSQKYEKIANVGLRTQAFETDEKRLRDLIGSNDALIQFERREGLKSSRQLQLAVGVGPDVFDGFVEDVQSIGKLTRLTINKSDKTNEYRELQAKRVSLEKTRAALTELKKREGEVPDMIVLEKEILGLEQQIQSLGVSLGDFDAENEFVTVKLVLAEMGKTLFRDISLAARALAALAWTIPWYVGIWAGLAFACVAVICVLYAVRLAVSFMPKSDKVAG